jgi:hypothetical protein
MFDVEIQRHHKELSFNVPSSITIVAPLLCRSVGVKPNTWKSWDLESSGTPECLELDSKGQNTSH